MALSETKRAALAESLVDEIDGLELPDLKAHLKKFGLSVAGGKTVLQKRLQTAVDSYTQEPEEPVKKGKSGKPKSNAKPKKTAKPAPVEEDDDDVDDEDDQEDEDAEDDDADGEEASSEEDEFPSDLKIPNVVYTVPAKVLVPLIFANYKTKNLADGFNALFEALESFVQYKKPVSETKAKPETNPHKVSAVKTTKPVKPVEEPIEDDEIEVSADGDVEPDEEEPPVKLQVIWDAKYNAYVDVDRQYVFDAKSSGAYAKIKDNKMFGFTNSDLPSLDNQRIRLWNETIGRDRTKLPTKDEIVDLNRKNKAIHAELEKKEEKPITEDGNDDGDTIDKVEKDMNEMMDATVDEMTFSKFVTAQLDGEVNKNDYVAIAKKAGIPEGTAKNIHLNYEVLANNHPHVLTNASIKQATAATKVDMGKKATPLQQPPAQRRLLQRKPSE